jgi:hypothetical protein
MGRKPPPPPAPRGCRWVFAKRFWHWRAKKYLNAADYGLEAFRFLVRGRGK